MECIWMRWIISTKRVRVFNMSHWVGMTLGWTPALALALALVLSLALASALAMAMTHALILDSPG
jgi:hypothetical protein